AKPLRAVAVDGVSAALAMSGRAAATATTRSLGENENSMQNASVSCRQNVDVIKGDAANLLI
nr:hypothetical protein [Escherichia coli]